VNELIDGGSGGGKRRVDREGRKEGGWGSGGNNEKEGRGGTQGRFHPPPRDAGPYIKKER